MWKKYVRVGHGTLFKGPTGSWKFVITVNKKDKCYATGTKDREEAERKRLEIIERIRQERIEELSRVPLLGAWSLFEASPIAARIEGEGMINRFRMWSVFALWMQENHPDVSDLAGVDRRMVNGYVESYRSSHTAATTNKNIFLLKGMVGVMTNAVGLRVNPFDHVAQLQWDTHSRRSLTKDEIARLISVAGEEGGEYRMLFLIAVYTGLRLGECCTLKWDDIDIRRGIIQFTPSKTRKFANGQLVTVPLHWKLMQALLETPQEARRGAVLPVLSASYATNRWCAKKALKRIFEAAGIQTSVKIADRSRMAPEASFHSLRHSFVSFAANSGVPLDYLRSIVGHTTTAMTRHYYHADEDSLRMAVASVPVFDAQGNVMQKTDEPLFETREMREARISERLKEVQKLLEEGLISEAECNDACVRIMAEA